MGVDDVIDDALDEGPNTAANIADGADYSRRYIWERLDDRDDIERVDKGLFRFVGAATGRADAERLRDVSGALGRLKIEVNKGTETQDELFDRVKAIEAQVETLLDDLDG